MGSRSPVATPRRGALLALLAVAVLLALPGGPAEAAGSSTLRAILARGKLVVGVKADYAPFGFRGPTGRIVGIEPDLARDAADALGVRLELVPVQAANRMQRLQQGRVDVIIATMTDRADRRRVSGVVDPPYYASGTNLLAPSGTIRAWSDLRGKTVCGKQGAFYNKLVSRNHGAKILAFVESGEAKAALRAGRCVAWVFDDASIRADLASGEWSGFEMPLPSEDVAPWVAAVPLPDRDGALGRFMAGMLFEWHASGRLIELEKKWGVEPSAYLREMHERLRHDHRHLE